MNQLDPAQIKKYDRANMLGSIKALSNQVAQAWEEVSQITLTESFSKTTNVVVCGMGGSALGGRVADSLFSKNVRGPIEVYTEYFIPHYVNNKSLVILSSYSGNTEETLSAARVAKERGAQIFGISTGGKLAEFLKEGNFPSYIFDPTHNPSNQPRMALGYSITSMLAVLSKSGFFSMTAEDIEEIKKIITEDSASYDEVISPDTNLAKKITLKLKGKIPVLVASEHLVGSIHAFKNQLNENAKVFATIFDLPELNHHLMEGLRNPGEAKNLLHFIFFESDSYSEDVQKRYPITKEVVEKNEIEYSVFKLKSKNKISEVYEILTFGSFVAFYLAIAYELDPSPIPWVDYFKNHLD